MDDISRQHISTQCEKIGLDEDDIYNIIQSFTEEMSTKYRSLALGISEATQGFVQENPSFFCDVVILNHIIFTSRNTEKITIYRGITPPSIDTNNNTDNTYDTYMNFRRSLRKNIIDTFTTITSTSFDERIVRYDFASGKKSILMQIEVPQNSPCFYIGDLSDAPLESEVLLPAQTKFQVMDVKDRTKDLMIVKLRVLPSLVEKRFGALTLKKAVKLRNDLYARMYADDADDDLYESMCRDFFNKTKRLFFKL